MNNSISYRFLPILLDCEMHNRKQRYASEAFSVLSEEKDGIVSLDVNYDTETLYVTKKVSFIKIPLTSAASAALSQEFKHYCQIGSSAFKSLAVASVRLDSRLESLEMPKLKPPADAELFAAAKQLLETLREAGSLEMVGSNENRRLGMEFIMKRFGNSDALKTRLEELYQKRMYIGPTHGDFHQRNLLIDERGKVVMIDLNRFSMHDIQALDAVNLLIDTESRQNHCSWFEQLDATVDDPDLYDRYRGVLDEFDLTSLSAFLWLYFIDRVGKEIRSSSSINETWLNELDHFMHRNGFA